MWKITLNTVGGGREWKEGEDQCPQFLRPFVNTETRATRGLFHRSKHKLFVLNQDDNVDSSSGVSLVDRFECCWMLMLITKDTDESREWNKTKGGFL